MSLAKSWQLEPEILFSYSFILSCIHRNVIIFGECEHHDKLVILSKYNDYL